MKIVRDGREIELTAEERLQAYYEQEHEFDIEDIKDEVESRILVLTITTALHPCDGGDEARGRVSPRTVG